MGLTEAELAERSACPVERIEELVALGILVPRDEDGPFSAKDVHRVRLMKGFEDAGIDLDLIARGVEKGSSPTRTSGSTCPSPRHYLRRRTSWPPRSAARRSSSPVS